MTQQKSVLVTGSARRIGRRLALDLAKDGWDVAVHCNASMAEAEEVAGFIRGIGQRSVIVRGDLSHDDVPDRLIAEASAGLGGLTCLINNASLFADDRLDTLTGESWSSHMDVNLRAPVLLAQAFAAQAAEGASIINILDQRVLKPDPRFFSYGLSKSALWVATRTMAQALAPRIRVNGVGPGPILPSVHQTAETFAAEAAAVPMGRPGSPEAIARTVRWLVDADLVTGQMIAVDGGQHLAWQTPDIVE